ncbi:hypothetical protein CSV79_16290 [Sporosarcina sp. P13]|uniref:hypothetical protein n=1 Tax=Sporosarcina sp. P13 TaxID=2048263 RepID=UPI000C16B7D2|nr:hypothetical protein [Sporosarcina sp. P13]PIC62578.1 hypothetical protein CSV79_16290 [Sporosarcina sp. P13]
MSSIKMKIGIFVLILLVFTSVFFIDKSQKETGWTKEIYLNKSNLIFLEFLHQYNADDLQNILKRLNEIESMSKDEAVDLTIKASNEWSLWVQTLHNTVLTADYLVPKEDEQYGYNGYIVGSEKQYKVLSNLFTTGGFRFYFQSLEDKIITNQLNNQDKMLLQEVNQLFNSIHDVVKNNWLIRAEGIDSRSNQDKIFKMKEPFINSIEQDVK